MLYYHSFTHPSFNLFVSKACPVPPFDYGTGSIPKLAAPIFPFFVARMDNNFLKWNHQVMVIHFVEAASVRELVGWVARLKPRRDGENNDTLTIYGSSGNCIPVVAVLCALLVSHWPLNNRAVQIVFSSHRQTCESKSTYRTPITDSPRIKSCIQTQRWKLCWQTKIRK